MICLIDAGSRCQGQNAGCTILFSDFPNPVGAAGIPMEADKR